MVIAAINNDQLVAALTVAANNAMTVFATLDERILAEIKNIMENLDKDSRVPVYFYESG